MRSDPTVLAFDTSAAHCAAALLSDGRLLFDHTEEMTRGQAERLLPMLQELLEAQARAWADIDLLAVGIGPGNFTGIRIGVAAARGLALGLNIPAMGVSNFEIMRRAGPRDGMQLVSLAAPRGSLYLQRFDDGLAVNGPMQITPEQDPKPDLPDPIPPIIGHDACGLARFLDPDGLASATVATLPAPAPAIARIAHERWQAGETDPAAPAPLYVRPADAAPPRDAPPVLLD